MNRIDKLIEQARRVDARIKAEQAKAREQEKQHVERTQRRIGQVVYRLLQREPNSDLSRAIHRLLDSDKRVSAKNKKMMASDARVPTETHRDISVLEVAK